MTVHQGAEAFAFANEDLRRDEPVPELAPRPTIKAIRDAVCRHYGLQMNDLVSGRRAREVARPRLVGMYLATVRSLPEIGRHFGKRDHTTVIHAVRTIEALCLRDADLADDVAHLWKRLEKFAAMETLG